jgi:hypothetical protein
MSDLEADIRSILDSSLPAQLKLDTIRVYLDQLAVRP